MAKVMIPWRFEGEVAIGNVIGAVIDHVSGLPIDDQIIFDFSELSWIEGDGITCLSNLIEWLFKRGTKVAFDGHQKRLDDQVIRYLDDCQFFKMYLGAPLNDGAWARGTTRPLQRIEHARHHQWIQSELTPWLCSKFGGTSDSYGGLQVCLHEVFNNIGDHSTENIGCVIVQRHPRIERLTITISDFGVGIPSTMAETMFFDDDVSAIKTACLDGVTSKPHGRNMGIGLFHLLQNIVNLYSGTVSILSNRGFVQYSGAIEAPAKENNEAFSYPGTMIKLVMDTRQMTAQLVAREELTF